MIPEILTLLLPVGKYILASTLMALFYLLFYRGKTSYNLSRKYLVSIAILAILLSQFHIIVATPPVKIVKVEAAEKITYPVLTNSIPQPAPFVSQKLQEDNSLKTKLIDVFTIQNILMLIYGLVTLILIISFILQYFKIISMKRKGVVREGDGFEIVESADIPTPFSFCKTIFVGQNLTGNKRDVVIKHEQWHIRHHHYVDVMVMETLVRLFWFNPVLWWVRKELRNISEFQTDRSVLDEGHELYKYQTIILEEVMEQNPYLANGFNNSFTKKRFIMMKNTIQARFTLMRRVSILPFLIGVFCLLSFTEGKGETRFVMNVKENPTVIPDNGVIDTASISGILDHAIDTTNINFKVNNLSNLSADEIDKGINKASGNLGLAIDELSLTLKAKNPASRLLSLQKVIQLLEVNVNSSAVGQNQINEEFCASVTNEDLINAKTDFIRLKKGMDALKLEQNKLVKTQKFSILALSMFKVNMIKKVLEAQMGGLTTMLQDMMIPMLKTMGNAMENMASGIDDGLSKNGKSKNIIAPFDTKVMDSASEKCQNNMNGKVGDSMISSGNEAKISVTKEAIDSINNQIIELCEELGMAINELDLAIASDNNSFRKEKITNCIFYLNIQCLGSRLGEKTISRKLYASFNQRNLIYSQYNLGRIRKDLTQLNRNDFMSLKIGLAAFNKEIAREQLVNKSIREAIDVSNKKTKKHGVIQGWYAP